MTELKTLKDLKFDVEEISDSGHEGYKVVDAEDLRQEAIKWVKHWRSIDQHCVKCDVWNEKRQEDMMHFFNITEEELK